LFDRKTGIIDRLIYPVLRLDGKGIILNLKVCLQ